MKVYDHWWKDLVRAGDMPTTLKAVLKSRRRFFTFALNGRYAFVKRAEVRDFLRKELA